jgi:hypothetical protein
MSANHRNSGGLVAALAVVLGGGTGCALLGQGGKVRVNNQTAATPICRVSVGNGSTYRLQHIDPGQSSEVAFDSGSKAVCVYACESGVAYDRTNTTQVMGCQDLPLDGKTPDEVVMFDGPTKPEVAPAPGYRQAMWENNINPVFEKYRSKQWLTPYGQLINGWLHVVVEHPGVCSKTVHLEVEDRKGTRTRWDVDPKQDKEIVETTPPIWLSFSLNPAKADFPHAWDLPTGEYHLRVRDDCQGLDLVTQQYPEGATKRAQPAGGTASAP